LLSPSHLTRFGGQVGAMHLAMTDSCFPDSVFKQRGIAARILATGSVRAMPDAMPSETAEGAGKTGCPLHPRPTRKKHLRVRALTTGTGGITPAFPARWFTTYFALSSVNQLVATVIFARGMPTRRLSACMGAPGPHDFAVHEKHRSSIGLFASTASRLAFVTTRPPLVPRRDEHTIPSILYSEKQHYIFRRRLTGFLATPPDGQIGRGFR
jgi:hypothetical protein